MQNGDVDKFEKFTSTLAQIGADLTNVKRVLYYLEHTGQLEKKAELERWIGLIVSEENMSEKIKRMDEMHKIFFDTFYAAKEIHVSKILTAVSLFAEPAFSFGRGSQ